MHHSTICKKCTIAILGAPWKASGKIIVHNQGHWWAWLSSSYISDEFWLVRIDSPKSFLIFNNGLLNFILVVIDPQFDWILIIHNDSGPKENVILKKVSWSLNDPSTEKMHEYDFVCYLRIWLFYEVNQLAIDSVLWLIFLFAIY